MMMTEGDIKQSGNDRQGSCHCHNHDQATLTHLSIILRRADGGIESNAERAVSSQRRTLQQESRSVARALPTPPA
jgi:hypothetical protein